MISVHALEELALPVAHLRDFVVSMPYTLDSGLDSRQVFLLRL